MANLPPVQGGALASRQAGAARTALRPHPAQHPFSAHLKGGLVPSSRQGCAAAPGQSPLDPPMRPGATRDAKIHRESSHSGEESTGPVPQLDPLDPMARALLANGIAARVGAMQPALQANTEDAVARGSRVSLEQMMSRLVRRIAWSGDAHSGSARLEFGAGALEGATLTIHSERGVLRVALELPPGTDAVEWRRRISERLGARRLQVAELEVE